MAWANSADLKGCIYQQPTCSTFERSRDSKGGTLESWLKIKSLAWLRYFPGWQLYYCAGMEANPTNFIQTQILGGRAGMLSKTRSWPVPSLIPPFFTLGARYEIGEVIVWLKANPQILPCSPDNRFACFCPF